MAGVISNGSFTARKYWPQRVPPRTVDVDIDDDIRSVGDTDDTNNVNVNVLLRDRHKANIFGISSSLIFSLFVSDTTPFPTAESVSCDASEYAKYSSSPSTKC